MSSREKQDADNNLFFVIHNRIWGWYKESNGRVTLPPQTRSEFPEGKLQFGWLVTRNREEIRVLIDKGYFDRKILLGEPRSD